MTDQIREPSASGSTTPASGVGTGSGAPASRRVTDVKTDPRVLICLGPCHGEFYLPLDWTEEPVCPNNRNHDVAVYTSLTVYHYCDECGSKLSLYRAGYRYCAPCEVKFGLLRPDHNEPGERAS